MDDHIKYRLTKENLEAALEVLSKEPKRSKSFRVYHEGSWKDLLAVPEYNKLMKELIANDIRERKIKEDWKVLQEEFKNRNKSPNRGSKFHK